ncbi:hypothetical protein L596_005647 [Steinernema carpocapsae]|uniref:ShKT domain-containing protein n=1 Tax=Steinernema carpocapsae TaxID=34508 RepID=A0A4U8UZP7_STECR|nr:hypothetical protein L596_005647 [Steinernema carpocapsae]
MGRRKGSLLLFILLFSLSISVYGAKLSNVVEVACRRNPNLKMCTAGQDPEDQAHAAAPAMPRQNETVETSESLDEPPRSLHQQPSKLSRSQYLHLRALAAQIAKVPGNPFVEQVRKDEDLVEFAEEDDDDRSFVNNQHRGGGSFVRSIDNSDSGTRVQEYCGKYQENYKYYCHSSIERNARVRETLYKFCPSYESNCPDKAREVADDSRPPAPGEPNNPFGAGSTRSTQSQQPESGGGGEAGFPDVQALPKHLGVPCTPDCDIRVHRHCTPECKCDFLYPLVQKFCNPPPLPLFLSTCRLWYNGCPKYERYHYASQFIYSKAEKGKVVSGTVRPANGAPPPVGGFGGAGPGFGGFGGALAALAKAKARGSTSQAEKFEPRTSSRADRHRPRQDPFDDYQPRSSGSRKENQRSRAKGASFRNENYRQDEGDLSAWSPQDQPGGSGSRKEDHRPRAKGALFRDENYRQDEGDLSAGSPQDRTSEQPKSRPRALQGNFPVVPDDAAFQARGAGVPSGFHQFDGLTDSQGVLHRPRSRSPFTKPGLWEPNPDNPHNRDHANKWYYHPDSVTADWLNGQVNWGRHWAVPAAGVGGTDGYSTLHFPTIGTFFNIADDYD